MMQTIDEVVDPALLRVLNSDGYTKGTAFRVMPEGVFLTCHHVIRDSPEDIPVTIDGINRFSAQCHEQDRYPALDLAVLRCPALPGQAVPLATDGGKWSSYWSKGFGWQSSNVVGPVPAEGIILSTSAIRYGEEPTYTLDEVLVLGRHSSFDGGLSGAPLFDAKDRVVIGVVNTRYAGSAAIDGFALRLETATKKEPRIAQFLVDNRRVVPHFGRHLNALVAREMCKRQRAVALDTLVNSGQVMRAVHCARRHFQTTVEAFLGSAARVLAVVGESGVGKTAEMADLALPRQRRVCLLLLGAHLNSRTSLASAIEVELARQAEDGSPVAADRVVYALDEQKQQLIVLLDGLNEMQDRTAMATWLSEAATWLQNCPVKMIVTSRPEFWRRWEGQLPQDLLYKPGLERDRVGTPGNEALDERAYRLDNFDTTEAETAIAIYGLGARGLRVEDVRYPFFLRVYRELAGSSDPVNPLNRYQALEVYVRLKCEAIARTLDIRADVVRDVLAGTAEVLRDRSEARISMAELRQQCVGLARLDDELLNEHVLVLVPGGVRFVFDQVPEFLQAELIEPSALVADALAAAGRQDQESMGTHLLALLRLEGTTRLNEALDVLVAKLGEYNSHDLAWWDLWFLVEPVIRQVRQPITLLPQIVRLGDVVAREWAMATVFVQMLESLDLPCSSLLEVLRVAVRAEADYDFREKDWDRLPATLREGETIPFLIDRAVQSSPAATFELLLPWLSDNHQLKSSHSPAEATVADVARAIMYFRMDLAADELFDLLVGALPGTEKTLQTLSRLRPEIALTQCERLVATGRPRSMRAALDCAAWALVGCRDPDQREALLDVVREIYSGNVAGSGRHKAFLVLLSHRETAGEFTDAAIALLHAPDSEIKPVDLYVAFRQEPERVLPELFQYVETKPSQAKEVAKMASDTKLSPALEERFLRWLTDAYEQDQLDDTTFALAVEQRLYAANDFSEPSLREIINWMAGTDVPVFHRVLGYFLDYQPRGVAQKRLQGELRSRRLGGG